MVALVRPPEGTSASAMVSIVACARAHSSSFFCSWPPEPLVCPLVITFLTVKSV